MYTYRQLYNVHHGYTSINITVHVGISTDTHVRVQIYTLSSHVLTGVNKYYAAYALLVLRKYTHKQISFLLQYP